MTAESTNKFPPPLVASYREFRPHISTQEVLTAEEQFNNFVATLTPDEAPEKVTPAEQEKFSHTMYDFMSSTGQCVLLPNLVRKELSYYYGTFPPNDSDTVHAQLRRAYQDEYLQVAFQSENRQRFPEIGHTWSLALAFRYRELPFATAAAYGLLTALGKTAHTMPHGIGRRALR
ncbi:hypothetical protein EYC58_00310 [Candidatus Saccharibacteria bacterium]|nr:MAG: hypothetical protein EYC58_00310 [Candidatus Saccharibacteria bacterium]